MKIAGLYAPFGGGPGFIRLHRRSRTERGEALLRVEYGGTLLGCRFEVEVEIGGEERWLDAEPSGFGGRAVVPHEVADQGILDREHRIAAEVLVSSVEDVRRHRLIAFS